MRIAIASDHAGFIQKAPLAEYLRSQGHEVVDMGPATDDRCDYPDFADKVARAVARGDAERGVLICGTGLGIAMAAVMLLCALAATAFEAVEGPYRYHQHFQTAGLH